MSAKLASRPVPHAKRETLEMLNQCQHAINVYESMGDVRAMILAMAEKAELLKQAVSESIEWAKINTPHV